MFIEPVINFVHKGEATLLRELEKFFSKPRVDPRIIRALPKETARLSGMPQPSRRYSSGVDQKPKVRFEWEIFRVAEVDESTE